MTGMGLFGGQRTPEVQTPPAPEPAPIPSPAPSTIEPTSISAQGTEAARKQRLNKIRSGIAGTIKTGPRGITGAGPELAAATLYGSTTLG